MEKKVSESATKSEYGRHTHRAGSETSLRNRAESFISFEVES